MNFAKGTIKLNNYNQKCDTKCMYRRKDKEKPTVNCEFVPCHMNCSVTHSVP